MARKKKEMHVRVSDGVGGVYYDLYFVTCAFSTDTTLNIMHPMIMFFIFVLIHICRIIYPNI